MSIDTKHQSNKHGKIQILVESGDLGRPLIQDPQSDHNSHASETGVRNSGRESSTSSGLMGEHSRLSKKSEKPQKSVDLLETAEFKRKALTAKRRSMRI